MTRRRKWLLLLLFPLALVLACVILLYSSWGLDLALRFAAANLPGQLSIASHQGSLSGPISLQEVHYRHDRFSVAIRQLNLDWHIRALLSGRVAISHLNVDDLDVKVIPASSKKTSQVNIHLLLPVAIDVQQASVNNLVIRHGSNKPVQITRLDVSAHTQGLTVIIRRFDVAAYQSKANITGTLGLAKQLPLKLRLEAEIQTSDARSLHTRGTIQGDLQNLALSQTLSGLMQARLDGTVHNLLRKLNWQAQLDVERFDLQNLITKSPPTVVQGKIKANGDVRKLQLDSRLKLKSRRIGLLEVNTKGDSDIRFQRYQFHTQGQFTGVDLPIASFSADGEGDHRQLQISKVRIDTLKGNVQGDSRVSWQPRFSIDAALKLHQLHIGEFSKQWPGQLSGELSLKTQARDNTIRFALHKLQGEVRGYPLQAVANGSWKKELFILDKLQMDMGGTHVQASGRLARQWDLSLKANSDNLNSLLPQARGSFKLEGRVTGNAKAPRVTLQADASQLAYADNAMETLALKLDMGLGAKAPAQADLQISSLQGKAGQWDKLHLQTAGSNASHTIMLSVENKKASLRLTGHGNFIPWRWRGQIDTFRYQRQGYGVWQLQKPVSMDLAHNAYAVKPLCLVQDGSQLCVDAQWHDSLHKLNFHAVALPLGLLGPWLPSTIQLKGQVGIQAGLQMTAGNKLRGQLSVRSPDKSVELHFSDAKQPVVLGASSLTAKLDDKGLHASLHLPLVAGGGLDSEASLPGWTPLSMRVGAQKIHGSVKIDQLPADIVTRFIPDLARAQGMLHANLQINGSLTEPRLRGEAQWQEGSVLVPPLGIHVRNVRLQLKSKQTNTVAFVLTAESGGGDFRLEGQTRLDPDQGWPTTAELTSHKLEVSNIPEAYILVDSKIKLTLQGSTIRVRGNVTVPKANLRPKRLPEGAIPLSRDVVIVRESKTIEKPVRWLISTRLRVHLGDEVLFNGFGIRGKLRGQLILNDEPGKLVLAQGEVGIVDGFYRLRGQDLTIRRGRLMFSNTFIDDPGLDVEAIRTIGTVTAGVRLKGTLKQPKLTVFSEPTMSESDALAYLITGSSMAQSTSAEGRSVSNTASALGLVAGDYLAQEVGGRLGLDELRLDVEQSTQNTALVMGKYLSPKLYLRYISGIVESSSIVQLQYQLSRRVQIQTEGGYRGSQSVTGGDIYFTIEY